MDIISNLKKSTIDSLGYETVYLEKPMSNLIDFDWKNILEAPPKNSSKTTIQELRLVSQSTQNRSLKDIELIHNVDQDLDTPFELLLEKYSLEYPKNYISLFYDIVYPVLINTKNYWNRPRPKQLAKYYNIQINVILTDTHHTAAYPSGHTVYSSLVSNILKDIYPEVQTRELDFIVNETARARVLQGVHFPSDNKASIIFSNYIFNKLQNKLRKYL
jgi:hypothetical protein